MVNLTTCLEIEDAFLSTVSNGKNAMKEHSVSNVVFSIFFVVGSLPIIFFGRKLFHIVAFSSAFFSTFYILLNFIHSSENISCPSRVITCIILAFFAGLLILSFVKCALFFIGATAFGSFAHFIIISIPGNENFPTINNNSITYYIVILISGIAGGICLKCRQNIFLEVSTAFIGSSGLMYGIHGLVVNGGLVVPNPVYLGIGFIFALLGFVFQRALRLKRRKGQRNNSV